MIDISIEVRSLTRHDMGSTDWAHEDPSTLASCLPVCFTSGMFALGSNVAPQTQT
jgi:hypothetical protein